MYPTGGRTDIATGLLLQLPGGDLAELPTTHNCAKKSQWARPGRDAVNGGAQRRRKVCTLRVQHVKRITILAAILVMLIALLAHGLMMRDCAVFRSRAHCFAPRPRLHAKWGGNVRNVVPVSVVPHRFETTFRADALELINTTSLVSELHRNQSIMSNSGTLRKGTVSDRYLHHTMSVDNRHFLLMPSNKLLHSKPLLVHKKRYDVLGVTDNSDHPTPQPSAVDSSKSTTTTTTTTTTRAPPQSLDRVRVAILSAYNDTNSFSCIAHASAILSGIPIINVGYRKAYSHIDRFNDYVRFLEVEMMSDSDVVIAMDSDIVFTGIDVRDYIQQFIDTTAATADDLDAVAVRTGRATAPIVFPAEKYCIRKQIFQGFDDCAAEYEAYEQRVSDEAITHGYAFESNLGGRRNPFRFLNGGTIVARVWALKELHAAMKSFMKVHVPTYYPPTWFCDQTIISSLFIRLLGIELDAGLMRIALLEGEIEAAEQRREALDRLIATTTTMTSRHYLMFQGRILSRWLIDNYATRHRLRKTLKKARLQPYDLRPGLIGLDTTSEFVFSSSEETIYKTDFKETPYVQHACLRCAPRKNSDTTEVNDRTEEHRSIGMEDYANLGLATWRVMESAQSLVRLIGSAMDAIMTPYLINPLYSIVVGSGSKTLPPRCAETDLLKEFHANRSTWRDPQAYLWLSLSESEEGVERYRHFYTSAFSDEPPVVSYETEQLLLRHYLAAEDQSLALPHSSSTHGLGSLLMDRRRQRQMVLSSASQEATGVGGASRSRTGAVISPGAIDVTSYPPLYVLLVRPTTESGGQDGAADALRRALMHAPANIPIDLLPAGNTTDGPTADLTAAEEAAWLFGTSIVMPSADDHHPQHRRAHTSGGGLFDVSNKHSKAYAIRTFQMRLQNIRAFQLKRGLAQNANLRKHGSSNREGGVGELFPSPAEQGQDAEDGVCGAPRDVDVSLEMYAKSHPIGFHFSGGWKEYNYDTYKYFYSWNIPIRFSFVSSRRSRSILGGAHLIMWEDNSTQLYPYVDMCGTPV